MADGGAVERFGVGRNDQIRLTPGWSGPAFEVRNIASRGAVWTGLGDATVQQFPPRSTLAATSSRLVDRLASRQGHVLLRVAADGRSFRTVVTSALTERDEILFVSDPTPCVESAQAA